MSAKVRRLILLFAAIGLAAASTSLYIHYQLLTQPGYSSPCDINATFSCTNAYRSQYGSLFGVPVALFGALWFLFVLLLVVIGGRGPAGVQESVPGYLFGLSTIGLAVILYLAYAAFFVLKELCLFCLVTYASVIGLFCLSGIATSIPMTTLPRRLFRDLRVLVTSPIALVVVVLFLAGAGSAIAFFPHEGVAPAPQAPANVSAQAIPANQQSDFEQYWNSLGRKTVPVSNEGAAVVIVKFTDYQCPMCGETYRMLRPILEKYQADMPGAVRLVSKDYPLDQSCNPTIPNTIHQGACAAAVAVRLAEPQRRAAEMEDWLYSNQPALTPLTVRQAAATVGHVANWEQGLSAALAGVKSDIALAQLMQIHQTPTFFVNGVPVPSGMLPQYWDLAIRLELKRAGRTK
jgi:uncharacterized membrane protein/protein-disulfide isomerase